jgi:plastocyanin
MLFVVGVVGFAGSVGFAGNTGGTAFAASTTVTVGTSLSPKDITVGTSLSPKDITVAPGTTVTWTATSGQHKLESTSGPEELKSDDLNAGSSWTHTFTKVGTYAYVDKENENNAALHGTVTVKSGAASTPGVPGAPAAPAPTSVAVTLAGKAFSPASVTVAVGGTVTWTNKDSMPHNVTANGGAFKSATLAPGAVFSFKFTTPGTYPYNCTFHGGMNGTVIVPSASGSVPPPVAGAPAAAAVAGAVPAAVAAAPGKPGKHTVIVTDAGFSPATLNALAGDTVTWVNKGQAPHTATAAGGAFDLPLAPGASASTVLQKPGTIKYVCTYHSYMTASIIVGAALPGTVIGAANNTSAGVAGATKPASAAPASTGKTKTVEIKVGEMSFTPAMAMANVGDTISWVNIGKIPHTVTAKDGSFDKTPIAPGERFNFVLRKEGSFPYVCSYHPGMDATLMVGPALAGVAVPGAEAGKTKPDSPAPVSTGSAQTHVIEVKDSSFTPATLEAHVGDTISWVNLGKIPHTVTARDHSFDKSLKPGQRFNLVLTKEGTIQYVCTPHPGMFGVLIVGPALNSAKTINAAPMTLESTPPVAMAGVGAGWLLIIGLLLVIQLRSRTTARATRAALHRRTLPGDPS